MQHNSASDTQVDYSDLNIPKVLAHCRYLPHVILALGAFFYAYEYMLQISPNVMESAWRRDFMVSAAAVGNLGAVYFWSYAPMQIPVGVLLDRFGPRILLTIAAALCAVGCFIFSASHVILTASIGRMFIGFGSAFVIISCFKLAASWFPHRYFALITGFVVTLGMMGAAFGQVILAHLVNLLQWRPTLLIFGLVGALLTGLVWLVVRDTPKPKTSKQAAHLAQDPLGAGLLKVLRMPQSWLAALYGGLMFAPTSLFGSMWGNSFLMQSYHISLPQAGGLMFWMFVGWAFGSPIVGWASDYIGRRRPIMVVGPIGALASMLCILYLDGLPLGIVGTLLFFFGFFSSGFLPAFSIIKEINPIKRSATAMGFMNMMNMLGGALLTPLVGYLLDAQWSGEIADGIHIFSVTQYRVALTLIPACIAVSLLILPLIKETYCKHVE